MARVQGGGQGLIRRAVGALASLLLDFAGSSRREAFVISIGRSDNSDSTSALKNPCTISKARDVANASVSALSDTPRHRQMIVVDGIQASPDWPFHRLKKDLITHPNDVGLFVNTDPNGF